MTDPDLPALVETPPGRYRHYKGMLYQVLGTVRHSETLEPMTLYRALYGEHGLWVRPATMFGEQVEIDGVRQPRFALLEPGGGLEPVDPLLSSGSGSASS
ncbi:MAG: DUF1653 domain-containing protein [Ramlibacter sp.]|nr:DUF1653 domain-containing protein [Ramlibacter sp.]